MTKAPTPTEKSKKQGDNTKTPPKNVDYTTIADRLRTATKLVWSNRFTGSQPFHYTNCKSRVIKRTHLKIGKKNHPCKDGGPTANQSREAIKKYDTNMQGDKTVYQKYIKTSARVGFDPPVWNNYIIQF